MNKPLRYSLIFCTLLTAVCLGATAAALSYVRAGSPYVQGWNLGLPLGRETGLYIHSYGDVTFGYQTATGHHSFHLPIPLPDLDLLALGIGVLFSLIFASLLARPLFYRRITDLAPAPRSGASGAE